MKRNLLLLGMIVFLCSSFPAFAQSSLWTSTYGGDYRDNVWGGDCIRQTTDGGFIVTGSTRSFGAGNADVYLIKTNSTGDTLWGRTYGGGSDDQGYSVQQTADGGYIVVGETGSFGAGSRDVYLIKTNSTGGVQWSRTFGGSYADCGYSVQQTTDGGYIVVGHSRSFGSADSLPDVYLIKASSTGGHQWSYTYKGNRTDYAYSIQPTWDGGYVMAGATNSFGASEVDWDVFLIKTNSTGAIAWTHTYGGGQSDWAYSVRETPGGRYIVAGWTTSFAYPNKDAYVILTEPYGGGIDWTRTFGGSYQDRGYSIECASGNTYMLVGSTNSFGAAGDDVLVIKFEYSGTIFWSRILGSYNEDYGWSIQEITDGGSTGYIVAGNTRSFGLNGEILVTNLDYFGNACMGEFVSPNTQVVSSTQGDPSWDWRSPNTQFSNPPTQVGYPVSQVTEVCKVTRGDATGDGVIDVGDVVYLVSYLYKGGPAPDPEWVGDANSDGIVNIGDVVYLVSYLYKGGPPPCSPGDGREILALVSRLNGSAGHAQVSLDLKSDPAEDNSSAFAKAASGDFDDVVEMSVLANFDRMVAGVELEVEFDPAQVTMLDPVLSPLTSELQLFAGEKDGIQKIGMADLSGKNFVAPGEGTLITLRARGSDLTSIKITKATLVDLDARPLALELSGELDLEVVKGSESRPQRFSLSHNYPNPFNPRTSIRYALPQDAHVRLTIYNLLGQKITTLVDEQQSAGYRTVWWDGKDAEGDEVSSGVYFYRLTAGEFSEVKKMMMVK